MARARVLDVGNCDRDHGAIRALLVNHFDVEVDRAMFVDEAILRLAGCHYDLVLVNRRIFADDSDGLELVHRMRTVHPDTPAMMISNFEAAQQAAIAAGAARGFGKAHVGEPATIERLSPHLPRKGQKRAPAGERAVAAPDAPPAARGKVSSA